jgi:N-acetylglucosaminyldiphosphoundecaprenol N-acetyl-beta-D-mannosaminyltransferase
MSTSHGTAESDNPLERRPRVRIGRASIDDLTLSEAIEAIADLVARGRGGTVCTPNVDHLVLLEDDARLRDAYASASLAFADGMPIVWASRLLGTPLREKVSGSDLIGPLIQRAAEAGWRVYLVGGGEGIAARAAERLKRDAPGLEIVGIDARFIDLDRDPPGHDALVAGLTAARPDLVLLALGCPKQEIVMHRIAAAVRPAVCVGVGAGLDFLAGTTPRAPRWISAAGLEWLYRLAREPRRLWRRYLVRDPRFALVFLRDLRSRAKPHRARVRA